MQMHFCSFTHTRMYVLNLIKIYPTWLYNVTPNKRQPDHLLDVFLTAIKVPTLKSLSTISILSLPKTIIIMEQNDLHVKSEPKHKIRPLTNLTIQLAKRFPGLCCHKNHKFSLHIATLKILKSQDPQFIFYLINLPTYYGL